MCFEYFTTRWRLAVHFMRFYLLISIFCLFAVFSGCSGSQEPASPLQTLMTYTKALKQKDTTTMKLLLSNETMRIHEQEAKSLGVPLDEIVKRESLISPDQTAVDYRNQKIEGDKASLEIKNLYGGFDTVFFVKEDGVWKIDKKSSVDQIQNDIDQGDKKMDDLINQGRQP